MRSNEFVATDDIFVSNKARHFHVPVVENVHLYTFANQRERNQHRVRSIPAESEVDPGLF